MFKKTVALLATSVLMTLNLAHAAVQGVDYEVMTKPIPQLQQNKVEVLEFFSYSCPHCYHLEPVLLEHIKKFPSDTYLRPVHVFWDENYFNLERIAAAVNSTHMKQEASLPIFEAIFEKHIDLSDPKIFKAWAAQQTSFNGTKLIQAYDSLENTAAAYGMKNLSTEYNIDETPLIIVGGKYRVKFPNGWEAGMNTVDELINQVRQERNLPAPSNHPVLKGIGAALAASANQ